MLNLDEAINSGNSAPRVIDFIVTASRFHFLLVRRNNQLNAGLFTATAIPSIENCFVNRQPMDHWSRQTRSQTSQIEKCYKKGPPYK